MIGTWLKDNASFCQDQPPCLAEIACNVKYVQVQVNFPQKNEIIYLTTKNFSYKSIKNKDSIFMQEMKC